MADEAVDGRERTGERSGEDVPGREKAEWAKGEMLAPAAANVGGRGWYCCAAGRAVTGGGTGPPEPTFPPDVGRHRSWTDEREPGRGGESGARSLEPEARRKGSTGSTFVGESRLWSDERETGLRTLAGDVDSCGGGRGSVKWCGGK